MNTILIFNLKLSIKEILNKEILEIDINNSNKIKTIKEKTLLNENIILKSIFNGITSLINNIDKDNNNIISIYDKAISISLDNNKHIIIPEYHYDDLKFKLNYDKLRLDHSLKYYLSDSINKNNEKNIKDRYYNDDDSFLNNKPIMIYENNDIIKLIDRKYELRTLFTGIREAKEDDIRTINYVINWYYLDNNYNYNLMILPKLRNNDSKFNIILKKIINKSNNNESDGKKFIFNLVKWKRDFIDEFYNKNIILKFNYKDKNYDINLISTNKLIKEELFISFSQQSQINDFTTLKVKDIIDIIKNISFKKEEEEEININDKSYNNNIKIDDEENLIFNLNNNKGNSILPNNLVEFIKSTSLNNSISFAAMIYIKRYEKYKVQFYEAFIVSIYSYFIYKLELNRKKEKKEPYFITSYDIDLNREDEQIDDWLETNHIIEFNNGGILLKVQSTFSISHSILRFKFNLIINPILLKLIKEENNKNFNENDFLNKLF